MAYLTIVDGPGKGTKFELNKPILRVGRNEINDIVINNPSVSSFHCEIEVTPEAVRVRDLDSTNGTKVNGEPIRMTAVFRNDVVSLGDVPTVLEGDDLPQGNPSLISSMESVPRTTIVIAPKNGTIKVPTPKEFKARRDSKKIWTIIFILLGIAIIVAGVIFFKAFFPAG